MRVSDGGEAERVVSALSAGEERKEWEKDAARLYYQTGSYIKTAQGLGVSIYEVTRLGKTGWWRDEIAALERDEIAQSNVRMTRLLDMTLDELEDRLVNGDEVVVGGQLTTKKVDARTLATVANVIFDKRQLLRGMPTRIDSNEGKLEELADKLRTLGKVRAEKVIEGTVVEMEDARR